MDRYSYYSNHNIEARREKDREEKHVREEQRRSAANASLLRHRLGDMLDTENQRLRHERSLVMQDARMISATGSRVDILPDHEQDENAMVIPKAPTNLRHTLRSGIVRDRLDEALIMHEIDGLTMPSASDEQDEMAEDYQFYDLDSTMDSESGDDLTYGDETQEITDSFDDEPVASQIQLKPNASVSNESDDLCDYDSYLKMVDVQYVRRKIDTLREKQGRASNRGKQPNKRAERILTKQRKAARKDNTMKIAA